MEFEKRWCMFLTTGVWLLWKYLFFYVAIGRRVPITEEYFHYALNAFILTLVFAAIEKYTNTHIGKSLLATFMSAVFVVQIILENYMLEYLRFMPYSNWEWSMEEATVSGLTRYIKYGYPGYHWAFLTMLAICFIIIALRICKPKIMNIIKVVLFKKAEKTKRSLYFTILFEHFLDYITIGEYICLKDWYLNSDIKWSVISRVFEEEDWKEMDSIIFDPFVEYLENQKNKEQGNADEICESDEESKAEDVDDNNNSSNDIENNEKKPAICVRGDTHGDINSIKGVANQLELTENDILIVAGDFGFIFNDSSFDEELVLNELATLPFTLCFIDGNHENHPALSRYQEEQWNGGRIHRIRDNIYHLMRGQVFEIEGKKIFTMGGAYSVDRMFRKLNVSYWEEEIPTKEEMEEASRNLERHNYKVDYIITHTLPSSVKLLMGYEVSQEHEEDADFTDFLDEVREKVSYKKWYAGHFHMNKIVSPADNMIVLYEGVQFLD